MRRCHPFLVISALLALSCSVEQPEETVGCTSLADCDFSEVCDVARGKCVPIPQNGFKGRFSCSSVLQPGEKVTSMAGSEIVGKVGGDEWSFPVGAICQKGQLSDTLYTVSIQVLQAVGLDVLDVDLEWDAAQTGFVTIEQTWMHLGPNSATLWTPDIDRAIAYAASGSVTLSRAPEVGAPLEGYIDITMHEVVKDDVLFGVPCPRGIADCGWKMKQAGGASMCGTITLPNGRVHDVCTRSCQDDSDCFAAKGICNTGFCSRACGSDTDCIAPLTCEPGDPGESKGCF